MASFRVIHPNSSRFNMIAQSTAGVEFVGHLMRYAEVEFDGSTHKLLRLGNCEFEFDASEVVYSGAYPGRIETIQSALKDVFKDTISSSFRFVLPSSALTQFESSVANPSDEQALKSQIGFETLLFNGGESGGDVFPGEQMTQSSPLVQGYAVHHLSQRISDRIRALCTVFPSQTKGHIPSPNASLRSFRRLSEQGNMSNQNALLIGCYPDHTDYTVISAGIPVKMISRNTPTHSDRIYFGHEALTRLVPGSLKSPQVYVYGHVVHPDLVAGLVEDFGPQAQVLNPGPLVNLDKNRFEDGFPIEAFVPCLGASIR